MGRDPGFGGVHHRATGFPYISYIELQKQAVADRYYHQLHPKPWAKSPEEAAWALMQRIMGLGQWDGSRSWFRWSSPPSMTLASKYCPVDNPVQAFSTKLSRD